MSESIYEWIRPAPVVPEKPPMYHSKHPADAPLVGSTIRVTKAKHAHMGAELKATITPQEFLKSHSNPRHIHIDPHSIRELRLDTSASTWRYLSRQRPYT